MNMQQITARMQTTHQPTNIARQFSDVALKDLDQVRQHKARVEQIDRVKEGRFDVSDLSLLSYKQMNALSNKLHREPSVERRKREVEMRAAKEANTTHADFMKRPALAIANTLERVSLAMADRDGARQLAVRGVQVLLSGTRDQQAVQTMLSSMGEGGAAAPATPSQASRGPSQGTSFRM